MGVNSDRGHGERLSDLPAWGLEIMMGLYGPETVESALSCERSAPPQAVRRAAAGGSAVGFVPVCVPVESRAAVPIGEFGMCNASPELAEFAAIDALGKRLAHLFRRR